MPCELMGGTISFGLSVINQLLCNYHVHIYVDDAALS
uniref:Uncharacterized protein n=1 Tax=Anguilla anguilla TaxID=7936 RepID=A0A0E9UWR3_ANGAN